MISPAGFRCYSLSNLDLSHLDKAVSMHVLDCTHFSRPGSHNVRRRLDTDYHAIMAINTAHFSKLKPRSRYNFYILKSVCTDY